MDRFFRDCDHLNSALDATAARVSGGQLSLAQGQAINRAVGQVIKALAGEIEGRCLAPEEAAERLGLSRDEVVGLVERGELPAIRFEQVIRIEVQDLAKAGPTARPAPGESLSLQEAAERLGLTESTLRGWIKKGRIGAAKNQKGRWEIPAGEAARLAQERAGKG